MHLDIYSFFSGCISTSQQLEVSGTRWVLQSIHGQELLEDTAVTLMITERGISGSSGCNLYSSAQFTIQPKNRIEIKEVAHTAMGCYEPAGVMEGYALEGFTLLFDESTFSGTSSCREYEGTYQTDEDNIAITMLRMTTVEECTQLEQNAEGTYTTLLERIDQYNVSKNQLELYTIENDKLIYELAPDE